ncbi:MAG: hypothetical protein AAF468_05510 [Pseudomonadota bacterium]
MQVKHLVLVVFSGVLIVSICLQQLSVFVRQDASSLALAVNPFDEDARVVAFQKAFADPTAAVDIEKIAAITSPMLQINPADARGYAIEGYLAGRAGEADKAQKLMRSAQKLSRTELVSLQQSLANALLENQIDAAINFLDLIFRRYPFLAENYLPNLAYIIGTEKGLDQFADIIKRNPPWRSRVISAISRDKTLSDIALRLVQVLGGDATRSEVQSIMNAFVRDARFDLAYRFHLFARGNERDSSGGYINNGAFKTEPDASPFDWRWRSTKGVSISRQISIDGESAWLRVRFSGSPVLSIALSQYVFFPPGRYRFAIRVSAEQLEAPKELYARVVCNTNKTLVARLDIREGSYRPEHIETEFTTAPAGCQMYRVELATDLKVESFRHRYSGVVKLNRIAIERLSGARP